MTSSRDLSKNSFKYFSKYSIMNLSKDSPKILREIPLDFYPRITIEIIQGFLWRLLKELLK